MVDTAIVRWQARCCTRAGRKKQPDQHSNSPDRSMCLQSFGVSPSMWKKFFFLIRLASSSSRNLDSSFINFTRHSTVWMEERTKKNVWRAWRKFNIPLAPRKKKRQPKRRETNSTSTQIEITTKVSANSLWRLFFWIVEKTFRSSECGRFFLSNPVENQQKINRWMARGTMNFSCWKITGDLLKSFPLER